jgi:hypothetical protein
MGRLISGLWFLMGGSSAQMPALCKLIRTNNLPIREPFFYRENRSAKGGSATAVFEGRLPNIPGDLGIYRGRGVTAE